VQDQDCPEVLNPAEGVTELPQIPLLVLLCRFVDMRGGDSSEKREEGRRGLGREGKERRC